jgi:hypothetical protein
MQPPQRIYRSDKNKYPPLLVQNRKTNTDTSLFLIGSQSIDYGETINTNFYHLLENFNSDLPPANPISGQTWFNSDKNKPYVFDGKIWIELGYVRPPSVPSNAVSNAVVDITLSQLLPLSGGQMDGDLILIDTNPNDSDSLAVTKRYVDNLKSTAPTDIIPLTGNATPTYGAISSSQVISPTSPANQAADKSYADATVPKVVTWVDAELATSAGVGGYINVAALMPDKVVYVSGVHYLPPDINHTDISVDFAFNKLKCAQIAGGTISVTMAGDSFVADGKDPSKALVHFSARWVAGISGYLDTIRITRHGTSSSTDKIPVHYNGIGVLA